MQSPYPNPGVAQDLVQPQGRVADANHEYGLSGCLGGAGFRSARLVPQGSTRRGWPPADKPFAIRHFNRRQSLGIEHSVLGNHSVDR
jgi:hypothetical protein